MPSRPAAPSPPSDAAIVVVDDWRGTFRVPDDAADGLRPGPRWLVPVAAALGAVVAVVLLGERQVLPGTVALLAGAAFVASWGAVALDLGGARGTTTAIAAATAAWVPAAAGGLIHGGLDLRWVVPLLAVGALGQVLAAERLRARQRRQRDAVVLAATAGTREEGWVVSAAGPPWDRQLRVESTTGGRGAWSGAHTRWRAVRPGVGHPVAVWRADGAGPAVVLVPRVVG